MDLRFFDPLRMTMTGVGSTNPFLRLFPGLGRVVALGGDAVQLVLQAQGVDDFSSAGLEAADSPGAPPGNFRVQTGMRRARYWLLVVGARQAVPHNLMTCGTAAATVASRGWGRRMELWLLRTRGPSSSDDARAFCQSGSFWKELQLFSRSPRLS